MPLTGKNQFIALTDKELTNTSIQVIFKFPGKSLQTAADYKSWLVRMLFKTMLSKRYSEANMNSNSAFLASQANVGHDGWLCTYFVYDAYGRLRYQLEPEAVNYLLTHNWVISEADWAQVLNGFCYQYKYDDKGRTIWNKKPGAEPSNMLYDARDRIVFIQDGNQAAISQWTVNLYDELDRPVVGALYNTSKTIEDLKTAISNAVTITSSQGTTAFMSPVSITELNDPSITTILKYLFYDNYSFTSVKPFNNNFTNLSAYSNADPNVMPIVSSKRTMTMATGSMARVLGSNIFLTSTIYYDDQENVIQILKDNVLGGTDITTWQYHYDGKLLSTCSDHTTSGTGTTKKRKTYIRSMPATTGLRKWSSR